jgi:hypothetical protein
MGSLMAIQKKTDGKSPETDAWVLLLLCEHLMATMRRYHLLIKPGFAK